MEISSTTAAPAADALVREGTADETEKQQSEIGNDPLAAEAARAPNQIQFIKPSDGDKAKGRFYTKSYRAEDGRLIKVETHFPFNVSPMALSAYNLESAVEQLKKAAEHEGGYCMILGALNTKDERVVTQLKRGGTVRRTKKEGVDALGRLKLPCFSEERRYLHPIDFDPTPAQLAWCREQGLDVFEDAEGAVRACAAKFSLGGNHQQRERRWVGWNGRIDQN